MMDDAPILRRCKSMLPRAPRERQANRDTPRLTQHTPDPLYLHCATGLAGVGLGTAVGSLRGHSPLLYALHMGIGYGVFGATFSCTCVLTGRSKYES